MQQKIKWAEGQYWAKDMMSCLQNPKYHSEGNVWVHTLLVCEKLQQLEDYQELGETDREILEWACLLHDVGKPRTTVVDEKGEIVSNHHGSTGTVMARRIMADIEVPFSIRERACNLIRWHMKPRKIEDAEDTAYYVIFTSCLCENRLLYILSKADVMGRIPTYTIDIQWIDLWKEECNRFNCFSVPYKFENDHARLIFYLKKTFQPYYKPFMKDMFDVYMFCGLPGTGKTWWAKNRMGHLPLVELDMAREELDVKPLEDEGRVFQLTKKMCKHHMKSRTSFVFSAVNSLKVTRQRWSSLFIGYGAKINIVYLERPLKTVFKQNKERERPVPENVILSMRSRLEVPNWDECHSLELMYID